MNFSPLLAPPLLLALASCAPAQNTPAQAAPAQAAPARPAKTSSAAPPAKAPLPLRTLIVSGGPSPDYNQYAIESNARYLEKLTARAASQRVLFADGSKTSRTISAVEKVPNGDAKRVLAWLLDEEAPDDMVVYHAPALKRIDGAATPATIAQSVKKLGREVKPGESALLYFTGHGSPGRKPQLSFSGIKVVPDYENTVYAAWGENSFSVTDLAGALRDFPTQTPLTLVMVQCHAGGFANLLFEGGKPGNPLLQRDFCGFFAATAERQASGCTSEVDEVDYQDFTTHFFAALSGVSRDGRAISGADWDKNGVVSPLEAMAWTNLHDDSIDVPFCTSDAYLRSIWGAEVEPNWMKTSYSSLLQGAAPWQRATLDGLAKTLNLSGENRVATAMQKRAAAEKLANDNDAPLPATVNRDVTEARFDALQSDLKRRFPGLEAPRKSARFARGKSSALGYLAARRSDVALLSGALRAWDVQSAGAEVREAQCVRFVRAARTLWLENRLKTQGSAAQKAAFARLRTAESRNPLR